MKDLGSDFLGDGVAYALTWPSWSYPGGRGWSGPVVVGSNLEARGDGEEAGGAPEDEGGDR